MNWEDIEKELARKSRQEELSVDTEGLWSAIQAHIPVEKKKNRFLFWFLIGLTMLSTAFILVISRKNESEFKQNFHSNNQEHLLSTANDKTTKDLILIPATEKSIIKEFFPENKLDSKLPGNEIVSFDEHTDPSTKYIHSSISKTNESKSNSNQENSWSNSIDGSQMNSINLRQINDTNDRLPIIEATADKIIVENPHFNEPISVENSQANLSFLNINRIALLSILPLNNHHTNSILEQNIYNKKSLINKKSIPWYIELTGGLSLGYDNLSIRNDEWSDHLSSRQMAESSLLSYNGSINIGTRITNRWSVQTGVRFTNRYKRSSSTINFTDNIRLDDVVLQEIQTADGLQVIRGNTIVAQQTIRTVQRINIFRTIEIPIELLYTKQSKNIGWDIGINIATTINHSISGFIHPFGDSEYDLQNDPNDWFNNNQLWSSSIMGGVRLSVFPSLDLIGRMRYQHYWNSITSDSYGITESYSGLHLEIGTRINF